MEISGNIPIQESREIVWKSLNDPDILCQCIPGCEKVEKVSDTEFTAALMVKIGPMNARFNSKLILSDLDPPKSYRISEVSSAGTAGFAKGEATVTLEETEDSTTVLHYQAKGYIGGKILQLGGRLIESTINKYMDDFFQRLNAIVTGKPLEKRVIVTESTFSKHRVCFLIVGGIAIALAVAAALLYL